MPERFVSPVKDPLLYPCEFFQGWTRYLFARKYSYQVRVSITARRAPANLVGLAGVEVIHLAAGRGVSEIL